MKKSAALLLIVLALTLSARSGNKAVDAYSAEALVSVKTSPVSSSETTTAASEPTATRSIEPTEETPAPTEEPTASPVATPTQSKAPTKSKPTGTPNTKTRPPATPKPTVTSGTADSSHISKGIFDWPIGEGFSITSNYGYRKDPFTGETKYHGGTDIGAPKGTPILAAADGTVIVANSTDSWGGGWGYYVKIQHNSTYATLYAHCSRIAVVKGQEVKKGQVIAYVGTTGSSTGNHLHFEVYKDGTRTNPLDYFE